MKDILEILTLAGVPVFLGGYYKLVFCRGLLQSIAAESEGLPARVPRSLPAEPASANRWRAWG